MKKAIVIGAGLGGLATALRLSKKGYSVQILEKQNTAGGRLNILKKDGFTFDTGPSFFSMSYEFSNFFKELGVENPLRYKELDPLYAVYFREKTDPYLIYKDLKQLAQQFPLELDMERKLAKFLSHASKLFHDTEYKIIKRNYRTKIDYLLALSQVPLKHAPKMFRTFWEELERYFETEDVKVIFSLVAFFLGATPFNTPAVYTLLNYTELQHDGYWVVEGGMYNIVEEMLKLLQAEGVDIRYNCEVVSLSGSNKYVDTVVDSEGKLYYGDTVVVNGDAAAFRGRVLGRKAYSEVKLDKMKWTLAPYTIYLGIEGKLPNLYHHNYFLGSNFRSYASTVFTDEANPQQPYYYVNVPSKLDASAAPEGHESLFILCPVPDRRYRKEWENAELTNIIIKDLSSRIGTNLHDRAVNITTWNPTEWEQRYNLYRGSGLGLAHGLDQVGALRPSNRDELYDNLYYVGASTVPGTGLPMVIISSKLVVERILENERPL